MPLKQSRKKVYLDKLQSLCEAYPNILIVQCDHVGSKQMAEIRYSLRGKAVVLMGKNTLIRVGLRRNASKMPQLASLLPLVKLNVGLIFCIDSPADVRKVIMENKVPAPARQGVIAPSDVIIPPGPTSLDPSQTNFFQALGISTKIVKGQIEIQNEESIIKTGDKVGASQSVLLQKLNIRPFSYGLIVKKVYDDGSVYDDAVLDISDADICAKFGAGVRNVAALSRQIGLPTAASVPHCLLEGFKHCTSLCLDGEYQFPQMEMLRKMIEDPTAFAVAAAPAASGAAPAAAAVVEEEEEEEEDDMGFSLFD